jgi:hypothetical protein
VRRNRVEPLADELAAECTAFLQGGYAAALAKAHRPVPVWAWTNTLAHASEADLRELMRTRGRFARASGRWALACAYVAGEVLDLAERHGSLRRLQSAVLIPLELELATRADINTWRPGPWVATLTTALGDHKRAWDRQAKARSRRTRDG